jgi:hypothetical protein
MDEYFEEDYKMSSSGARFWETSIKGSLEGFKYLSSRKYNNFSTYLGTIITSLLVVSYV